MIVAAAVQLQHTEKENTDEGKTNSRKRHCVSHAFHDAHGGSNANAGERSWDSKPDEVYTTPKMLPGTVRDSTCGAHHMEKDKSASECT